MNLLLVAILLVVFLLLPSISKAKQGCCSWHGGVSHCDTSSGRQVCNDGSYSPSCTCQYIPPDTESWGAKYRKNWKDRLNESAPKPDPIITKIQDKVFSVKDDYLASPDGFRERLIDQICDYLGADKIQVATEVYRWLLDVK